MQEGLFCREGGCEWNYVEIRDGRCPNGSVKDGVFTCTYPNSPHHERKVEVKVRINPAIGAIETFKKTLGAINNALKIVKAQEEFIYDLKIDPNAPPKSNNKFPTRRVEGCLGECISPGECGVTGRCIKKSPFGTYSN